MMLLLELWNHHWRLSGSKKYPYSIFSVANYVYFKWPKLVESKKLRFPQYSVEKREILSHRNFFREIICFVTSLVKTLLSRNFWNFHTVRKFHNFAFIQFLREINFGDLRRAKSAFLQIYYRLRIGFWLILALLKAEIAQISKIKPLKMAKTAILKLLHF